MELYDISEIYCHWFQFPEEYLLQWNKCTVIMIISLLLMLLHLLSCVLKVVISGYNDKMRILMERIVSNIAKFEVKSNRFSVIKVIHKHTSFDV